jgi:ribosomal protein S16
MLKIRLQRTGRKNDPHFRLIVTESTLKPKTTQFAEILGTYNVKAGVFTAKADRIKHWISVGAQASDTVHNLLISKGIRSMLFLRKALLRRKLRNNLSFTITKNKTTMNFHCCFVNKCMGI